MRVEQLEAWVLSIVDVVANGHRFEDTRVELKAQWPEVQSAARRIAGHANAAGGHAVLWIIGLDEVKGVVPVAPVDVAEWRGQLAKQFDGVEPRFTDLIVPTSSGPVTALLFDTARRPYVVKNPVHGKQGGGPVSLEVPWRDGTATRSARREDLIRILTPIQALPSVEVLLASARYERRDALSPEDHPLQIQKGVHFDWKIRLTLYVTPRTQDLIVLPVHRARLSFALGNEPLRQVSKVRFHAPYYHGANQIIKDSQTITTTSGEALLTGPGKLEVEGTHYEKPRTIGLDEPLNVVFSSIPAGQDQSIDLALTLPANPARQPVDGLWQLGETKA